MRVLISLSALLIVSSMAHAQSTTVVTSRTAPVSVSQADLTAIGQMLRGQPSVETVESILPTLIRAVHDESTAIEALPILEQAIVILRPTAAERQTWPTVRTLLKTAARMRYEQFDPEKANANLRMLLDLDRELATEQLKHNRLVLHSRRLNEVALEYLHGGQVQQALELLHDVVDLDVPLRDSVNDVGTAVAGALNRRLAQLRTEQRYELLYQWTMPNEDRSHVQIFASLASSDAPPSVFARALGERPRETSFVTPEIRGVTGVFSSAWSLVDAAVQTGRLRRLTAELTSLVEQGQAGTNAEYLLLLARIADTKQTAEQELLDELNRRLTAEQTEGRPAAQRPTPGVNSLWRPATLWQFGYGQFDEKTQKIRDFKLLTHWTGAAWQGGTTLPASLTGRAQLTADGGQASTGIQTVRRWHVPAEGTLIVSGGLVHTQRAGDGVLARIVSSRSGLIREWTARRSGIGTSATLDVKRGETLDFVVDARDNDEADIFKWDLRLSLTMPGGEQHGYTTKGDFYGPTDAFRNQVFWTVLGAACVGRPALQDFGEAVFARVAEDSRQESLLNLLTFSRKAHAQAVLHRESSGNEASAANHGDLYHSDLGLWIPAGNRTAVGTAQGAVREVWLAHEDHMLHLAGESNDYLCFRYPLTGEFQFTVESQDGGDEGTQGSIAYGGLAYETYGAAHAFHVWGLDMRHRVERPCPFVRNEQWPTFQRLAVNSTADDTRFSINGHPMWTDATSAATSPWFALRAFGDRVPAFRNAKLTGNPIIPREVRMSAGNELRGWFADFYPANVPPVIPTNGETPRPTRTESPKEAVGVRSLSQSFVKAVANAFTDAVAPSKPIPLAQPTFDWSMVEGEIRGAYNPNIFAAANPSRLTYFRPLQQGESISYEFLYEPGRHEVHPALGRLAFLLDPSGVSLHWMTNTDAEWTGLPPHNSTIEPLSRRGPRRLPLKADEWNAVTISSKDDTVTLILNGETIYSRDMEAASSCRFGFYYDRNRTAARIRNVVMRGDWPERLADEQLENLFRRLGPERVASSSTKTPASLQDVASVGVIFSERHIADAPLDVHRRARQMSPEARYRFLLEWVLPGSTHDTWRLALDFAPTNTASPTAELEQTTHANLQEKRKAATSRLQTGGELVSPALDLVDVAQQLGQLSALRNRIESISVSNDDRRAQLTMLALVDMADKNFPEALKKLDQLVALVEAAEHHSFAKRFPETLAIAAGIRHDETRAGVRDMLYGIYLRQIRAKIASGSEAWARQLSAYASILRRKDLDAADTSPQSLSLTQWAPVSRVTAATQGSGYPVAQWRTSPGFAENISSHDHDFLYFQSPIRGDFEVEWESTGFGFRDMELIIGGLWVTPVYNHTSYAIGDYRTERPRISIEPRLAKVGDWIHHRTIIRDGVCTTYCNGRILHQEILPANFDPWLAIRSIHRHDGAVRNLRISGQPVIPAEIHLASSTDLSGWMPYYDESCGKPDSDWRPIGDADSGEIVGIRNVPLPNSHSESLLYYHRPLLEDGSIAYEFYHDAGVSHVHPALGRTAFLLEPQGVRLHALTDGRHDRTALDPLNVLDVPANRRGPEQLPLKQGWNHATLTLTGDAVDVKLNGQLVYRRTLKPTNQRHFGLFHFADQTEARVRNIVWTGNWPRSLPAIPDQELADEAANFLDERSAELPAVFEHDFTTDGFPSDRFNIVRGHPTDHVGIESDGIHVMAPGGEGYIATEIAPRVTIEGDFDITATFADLQLNLADEGTSALLLRAMLSAEVLTECIIYRQQSRVPNRDDKQYVQSSLAVYEPKETKRDFFGLGTVEAMSGRLRLSRRGDQVYFLFAEHDSDLFRQFGVQTVPKAPIQVDGLRLAVQTHGQGSTRATWKHIAIRAEKLVSHTDFSNQMVAELDQHRQSLAARLDYDFSVDEITEENFRNWGHAIPLTRQPNGLPVKHAGTEKWSYAGLATRFGVSGDFDIAATFDLLNSKTTKPGQNAMVYLMIGLDDQSETSIYVALRRQHDGRLEAIGQVKQLGPDGLWVYRPAAIEQVQSLSKCRIVRRGSRIALICSESPTAGDRVLFEGPIGTEDLATPGIRLMVHAGGDGSSASVLWKTLSIRADKLN